MPLSVPCDTGLGAHRGPWWRYICSWGQEEEDAVTLSMTELAQAREVVQRVLEELQLDAYLYEVEPREGQWAIKVECAAEDGWETCRLTADKEYLLRGADDAVVHEVLIDNWREALADCRRKG